MLVLTRKERELVVLRDSYGQKIAHVRICRIMGDSVSIGFDAPDWVRIYRNEIDPNFNSESKEVHDMETR